MGVSYNEAVAAQAEIEDQILTDPNVVSVGVIAEINELGEKTGEYVIKVGVISIEDYRSSLTHGDSLIPRKYNIHREGNQEKKSVRIQVVKTGQIRALSALIDHEKKDFPSAVDDIPAVDLSALGDQASRRRPSPGGYSIGHPTVTAGTLGLLVEYENGPNRDKAFILGNNHVIAANNLAHVGDEITQPGRHDAGVVGRDTIALLHRWVPLQYAGINFVDAAIAEVKGGLEWKGYVVPYVSRIGYPAGFVDAEIDMRVEKMGRTMGYTTGTILSVNHTVKVDYGNIGKLLYKNQICTTSMSRGGDSGSCLFENDTKKPVGLLFAGDNSETFHNPMGTVLTSLSMKSINRYPSGKTHTFAADYPLRILQTRSYATSIVPNFAVPRNYIKMGVAETRYGTAIAVTSIGPKKLSASFHSFKRPMVNADGFLYRALSSSSFFRSPSVLAKPKTAYCRNQLFGSIIKLCSRR